MAGSGGRAIARWAMAVPAVAVPVLAIERLWHAQAARHPYVAFAAVCGYELALVAARFGAKVAAGLRGRLEEGVTDWAEERLRSGVSGFGRRYRRFLRSRYSASNLKGIAIQGVRPPRLEDVFVDVSLEPSPPHEAGRAGLTGADRDVPVGARLSLRTLVERPEPQALALIGSPGSGKTTLLEYLTLTFAAAPWPWSPRRRLPVFLTLRDHAEQIAGATSGTTGSTPPGPSDPAGPPDLPGVIRSALSRAGLSKVPAGWFERRLEAGRCVVMLDGLDEVARTVDRRRVADWVERQIDRYPGNHWVLTSRPHGYAASTLRGATVLQVRRFTPDQITRFVHGWYQAVQRVDPRAAGGGAPLSDEAARGRAEDLLRRLRDEPSLFDLAANPLLLTMIANVHRYHGALPGTRSRLYDEICKVLLWRRQEQAKGIGPQDGDIPGEQKEAVLAELAWRMMRARLRDIDTHTGVAEEWLRPHLDEAGFTGHARRFLDTVATTGLLIEHETGTYAFAHQTFQEYLAAARILASRDPADLLESLDDPWWRETVLLWAARTDPHPVVAACLDRRTAGALALALDCAEESRADGVERLRPRTAERLEEVRREALTAPPDSELGRMMTAVTVQRQLRRVVWLRGDTLITARPITRALHRLFVRDHPEYALPGEESAGAPDDPALTIGSPEAAEAFVGWVNARLGAGSSPYRLPTRQEADDEVVRALAGEGRLIWVGDIPGRNVEVTRLSGENFELATRHPWMNDPWRMRQRVAAERRTDRAGRALAVPPPGPAADDPPCAGLRAARTMTGAVRDALLRDLQQVLGALRTYEELSSPSPTSGRMFDTTNPRIRDVIEAIRAALDRPVTEYPTGHPRADAVHLGRRLTEIAELALLRARADGELTAAGGQVPGRYHGVVRAGFLAAIRPSQALDAMLRSLQAPAPGDAFDPLDLLLPLGETLMRATERPGSVLPGTTMGLAGLLAGRGHDPARAVVNLARERSVVWPHRMRGHLEALPGLVDHQPRAEGPPASPPRDPLDDRCARQLARQVRELGMTFLTDPDPGDDDLAVHAMAVRVGALTLAELTAGNPLGDEATHACLSIAAGVTIVQDRAEGRIQPNEALMLVRT